MFFLIMNLLDDREKKWLQYIYTTVINVLPIFVMYSFYLAPCNMHQEYVLSNFKSSINVLPPEMTFCRPLMTQGCCLVQFSTTPAWSSTEQNQPWPWGLILNRIWVFLLQVVRSSNEFSCGYQFVYVVSMVSDRWHYSNGIMSAMASEISDVAFVCSTVCSGADQRKHQSSASLAFVRGIHRWNPLTKGQFRGKCFHSVTSSWNEFSSGYKCVYVVSMVTDNRWCGAILWFLTQYDRMGNVI